MFGDTPEHSGAILSFASLADVDFHDVVVISSKQKVDAGLV
ncbi:hypothetical protein [Trueperella pyogenes]